MSAPDVVEIYSSEDEKAEATELTKNSTHICTQPRKRKHSTSEKANDEAIKCVTKETSHTIESRATSAEDATKSMRNTVVEIDLVEPDSTSTTYSLDEFINNNEKKDFTLEFLQLLETCLKYENSDGMKRIVCRNLIPRYHLLNASYKSSLELKIFLKKIVRKLKKNPCKKFSCLKEVSDHLKNNTTKKKVNFITLNTEVSDKTKKLCAKDLSRDICNKETSPEVNCVIDLDDYDDIVEVTEVLSNDGGKENDRYLKDSENNNSVQVNTDNNNVNLRKQELNSASCNKPTLLIEATSIREQKVKTIESEIKLLKNQLAMLETLEVTQDDFSSPYLCCDGIKRRIVELYTELLELHGEVPCLKSKSKITVAVAPGTPPGPARAVQAWLREPTDDGHPRFPNIRDVFNCVAKANMEDGLGWSVREQWDQAVTLFRQTGASLQRRRRRREWRDLLRLLPDPADLDTRDPADLDLRDPADLDPHLRQRLDENRARAQLCERELLQHYAKLEEMPRAVKAMKVVAAHDHHSFSSTKEPPAPFIEFEVPPLSETNMSLALTEHRPEDTDVKDVKPLITPNPIDPNTEIVCSDSDDYSTETEESDIEFDIPDNCLNLFVPMRVKEEAASAVVDTGKVRTGEDTLKTMLVFDKASLEGASFTTIFEESNAFSEMSSSDDNT